MTIMVEEIKSLNRNNTWELIKKPKGKKMIGSKKISPVLKHTLIRIMSAIVALFDLKLEQFDVKMTFLYDESEEHIYM